MLTSSGIEPVMALIKAANVSQTAESLRTFRELGSSTGESKCMTED